MPKYYDDPIKRKWRMAALEFSVNTLAKRKKPRDWKVLCMPAEEGYEIEQNYLPIGVQPGNITALEWKQKKATRLANKFPGINVVYEDVKDFLRDTGDKFDFINLDYESTISRPTLAAMRLIAGRQLLNDPGIFGLTVLAQRDDAYTKKIYRQIFLNNHFGNYDMAHGDKVRALDEPVVIGGPYFDYIDELLLQDAGCTDLLKIKESVHANIINNIFLLGKGSVQLNPIHRNWPQRRLIETDRFLYKKTFDDLLQKCDGEGKTYREFYNRLVHAVDAWKNDGRIAAPEDYSTRLDQHGTRENFGIDAYFTHVLIDHMEKIGYPAEFTRLMEMAQLHPYFAEDGRSYRYVSENGSLMFSDFVLFNQKYHILEKYRRLGAGADISDLGTGPLVVGDLEKDIQGLRDFVRGALGNIQDQGKVPHIDAIIDSAGRRGMKRLRKSARNAVGKWKADAAALGISGVHNIKGRRPVRIDLGTSTNRPELAGKEYYTRRFDLESGLNRPLTAKEEIDFHAQLIEQFHTNKKSLQANDAVYTMEKHGRRLRLPQDLLVKAIAEGKSLHEVRDAYPGYSLRKNEYSATKHWLLKRGKYADILQPRSAEPPALDAPEREKTDPFVLLNSGSKQYSQFSRDIQERMRYFIEEDMPGTGLSSSKISQLYADISASRWYRIIAPDSAVMAFFDDIFLYAATKNSLPGRREIESMYRSAISEFAKKK